MPNEPIFRELGQEELEKILELEELAMNTDTSYPLTRHELEKMFEDGGKFYGLMDGEVLCAKVGFAKEGDNRFEFDIAVHPGYQGKGLGRKIMQSSIKSLRSDFPGCSIYLKVHPDNRRAVNLYLSEGFQESGRIDTPHGPRLIMDLKL